MKDALGHGSNARDVNDPVYTTKKKPRGYNTPVSPLTADYATAGRLLREAYGRRDQKDQHLAAGDEHAAQAFKTQADHAQAVASARSRLGSTDPGPLISGIVSDKFSEADKYHLRDLALKGSAHTSAAFAHYAVAGLRLNTARARYQGAKR